MLSIASCIVFFPVLPILVALIVPFELIAAFPPIIFFIEFAILPTVSVTE